MSLSNEVVKQIYTGNGSVVDFAIPFAVLYSASAETRVVLRDETDAANVTETLWTEGVEYTLTGAPIDNVRAGTAPTATQKLLVKRQLDLTQLVDFLISAKFPVDTNELQLDNAVALAQQLDEISDRSLQLPETQVAAFDTTLPPNFAEADHYLKINTAGNGIETVANIDANFTVPAGTGILSKISSLASVVRTLTGSSSVTVVNGDGVSGNPTFSVPVLGITNAMLAEGYINDLTAVTAASGDYIAISDASDSGKKKKILVSDLVNTTQISIDNTDSPYTALATDNTILVDASSGAVTVNLPTAASITGKRYTIKAIDATNNVTVDGDGSETIEGVLNKTLNGDDEFVTVESDGAGWVIVSEFTDSFLAATSSAETTPSTGVYMAMTGNEVTLTPGSWSLSGEVDCSNSGGSGGFTRVYARWALADGDDTSGTPSTISGILDAGIQQTVMEGNSNLCTTIASRIRVTVTAATTVYLVAKSDGGTAANQRVTNTIYAQRIKL